MTAVALPGRLFVPGAREVRTAQLYKQRYCQPEVGEPQRVAGRADDDKIENRSGVKTRAKTKVWISPIATAPPAVAKRSSE